MLAAALGAASSPASAIVISDDLFRYQGGHLDDIEGTLRLAMDPQVVKGAAAQFDAVGRIGRCTATWIGDAADEQRAFFLTAAQCVEGDRKRETGPITADFIDRDDEIAAGGTGTFYLPPDRLYTGKEARPTATDIALVALPRQANIIDADGQMIQPPVLYDGDAESGKDVWFAGYGLWGTGSMPEDEAVNRSMDERRAAGASRVERYLERKRVLSAPFDWTSGNGKSHWARPSRFDEGAAWWQQHDGRWVIVATQSSHRHNPGDYPDPRNHDKHPPVVTSASLGARVSAQVKWIRSIFPEARLASNDALVLTADRPVSTWNLAQEAKLGSVAYVVPPQSNVIGPSAMKSSREEKPTMLTVTMTDIDTTLPADVKVRATRDDGCDARQFEMNSIANCQYGTGGYLTLAFDRADNPGLRAGTYTSRFTIEAQGWEDAHYRRTIKVRTRIVVE